MSSENIPLSGRGSLEINDNDRDGVKYLALSNILFSTKTDVDITTGELTSIYRAIGRILGVNTSADKIVEAQPILDALYSHLQCSSGCSGIKDVIEIINETPSIVVEAQEDTKVAAITEVEDNQVSVEGMRFEF